MRSLAVGAGVIVAVAAHLFLGWVWSVTGAILAGFLVSRRGWWAGTAVMLVSWGGMVAWNLAVAPAESLNMMETLGGLLGGMPPFVAPLLTVAIAALLGMAGGWLGSSLKPRKST